MPVMRQGVSSRVISRNLPLFATFSSLIYALLQRLEVRDNPADEVTVTLIGKFSGEILLSVCRWLLMFLTVIWEEALCSLFSLKRWPSTKEIKRQKCMSGESSIS